jgi:hypothetical protein
MFVKSLFNSYKFSLRHLLIWLTGFLTLLIVLGSILILIPFFLNDNTKLFRLVFVLVVLFITFLSQLPLIISPFVENVKSNIWRVIIILLMLPAVYLPLQFLKDQLSTIFIAPFNSTTFLKLSPIIILAVYALQIFILLKKLKFGNKDEIKLNLG